MMLQLLQLRTLFGQEVPFVHVLPLLLLLRRRSGM